MARRLPCLALAGLILILEIFPLFANDLWMHLRLGQDILASGIPRVETYSYTAFGRPFVYHEWLSGVALHLVNRLGGTTALVLLQPAIVLLLAWILLAAAQRLGADPEISALLVGIGIYAASFRLFLRPHLLALPLLAATLWLLLAFRDRGGWRIPAALMAVQIVWANTHGSFPSGVALAALFGLGETVRRRTLSARTPSHGGSDRPPLAAWAALPAAMLGACFVNPYGWDLVRLAILHPIDPLFRERIFEYFPAFSAPFRATRPFLWYLAWLGLFALALLGGVARRRLSPALLLVSVAFLSLSLLMNRAIADFVVVSSPLIAAGFSGPWRRLAGRLGRLSPIAAAAPLALMAVGTLAFGYPIDAGAIRRIGFGAERFTPKAPVAYLRRIGFRGNVFCSFPYGSYLAYRLAPGVKVVFDSRTIPYGADLYREFQESRSSLAGLEHHLARYRVDAALLAFRLDRAPEIHARLSQAPDWGLVHFDDESVLYLRDSPETSGALARDRLECASPVRFDHEGIAAADAECWARDCRRLLATDPDSALPRFLLAAALEAEGKPAEALAESDRVLARRPDLAYVHRLRALLFEDLGDAARAGAERAEAERLTSRAEALP
jgi:hypothetical protein